MKLPQNLLYLLFGMATMVTNISMTRLAPERDPTHGHSKEFFENLKTKYKDDKLYVHLVPHTHDEVGWLK